MFVLGNERGRGSDWVEGWEECILLTSGRISDYAYSVFEINYKSFCGEDNSTVAD